MAIRSFRPVTPSLRFTTIANFDEVTTSTPEKSLLEPKKKSGGRNNNGRITSRFRGGGHKQHYRVIDFKRNKFGIPATVSTIEYDPNRSARIALLVYADGEKRYILAPDGIKVGQVLVSGEGAEIKDGNSLPLKNIPVGSNVHNIELKIGRGGQMARSAGASAQLAAKEGDYATLKLPSGEMRMVHINCMATLGVVSNADHFNKSLGKAGRNIWRGRKPHNRGVTMNPVDHPMGGGEGRTSGGGHPVSPWGQKAKGLKTRKRSKVSNKMIVRRRNQK